MRRVGLTLLAVALLPLLLAPITGARELAAQNPPGRPLTSFENDYDLYVRRFEAGAKPDIIRTRQIEKEWSGTVFLQRLYPALDIDSFGREAFNEALFRKAVSQYERAEATRREFESKLEDVERDRIRVDTWKTIWWQNIEGHEALNRRRSALRRKYMIRLSNENRAIFETLGQIGSARIRAQRRFINLQKTAYRMFSVYQIGIGRYAPALDILKKYERFDDVEAEWPMHYYISRSFGGLLRGSLKDRSVSQNDLQKLRRGRNLHFLRAVALKFGRDSLEYSTTLEKIRLDELGPVRR